MIVAALATGSLMVAGCSTPTRSDMKLAKHFNAPKWFTKAAWSKGKDEHPTPYPGPVKLATTWTPDVLVQSGRTPTRGFGGRLFFFDEKTKAVPVEGTLTVHGFEAGEDGKDSKIKPFKFTQEQFTRHYSQSDFGASYSVWIPWDAAGGEEKRVSLVATFESSSGKIVQGSPTTIILPGTRPKQDEALATRFLSPQYQDYKDALAQNQTRPSGLVTTTIRRNSKAADRLHAPGGSLQERINSIAASTRSPQADGTTPFLDVRLSEKTMPSQGSAVMAASAVVPTQEDNPVRSARHTTTVPRRIKSPVK
jgi:hypothetical protein